MEEAVNRTSAMIDRAWGKYALVLLKTSQDEDQERKSRCEGDELEVENIEDAVLPSPTPPEKCVVFESMEVDPQLQSVPIRTAAGFDEARDIFLHGLRLFKESQKYHSMEEHCSDYTEIQQDMSLMYKVRFAKCPKSVLLLLIQF